MINIYEAIDANKRKSFIIVAVFLIFIALAVYFIGAGLSYYFGYDLGPVGIGGIALIVSGSLSFVGYYYSDTMVLAISGAKKADPRAHKTYFDVVQNICIGTALPMPALYLIDDTAPNAFATGRDPQHAAVCATTGILQKLTRTELEGVMAHELTHIRNYDTRLMAVVAILVGSLALLADFFFRITYWGGRGRDSDSKNSQLGAILFVVGLIFAIISPVIAQLIQLAISRRREFFADAGAVAITRQPGGLISALTKISSDSEALEAANKATAHLYIVNPFKDKAKGAVNWFSSLFNTHPPLHERIKALEAMS